MDWWGLYVDSELVGVMQSDLENGPGIFDFRVMMTVGQDWRVRRLIIEPMEDWA